MPFAGVKHSQERGLMEMGHGKMYCICINTLNVNKYTVLYLGQSNAMQQDRLDSD